MGIVAKNIVKKEKPVAEKKESVVGNNISKWHTIIKKPQEVIETPVSDTETKRQPSSQWLSIKESDYVSHSIK